MRIRVTANEIKATQLPSEGRNRLKCVNATWKAAKTDGSKLLNLEFVCQSEENNGKKVYANFSEKLMGMMDEMLGAMGFEQGEDGYDVESEKDLIGLEVDGFLTHGEYNGKRTVNINGWAPVE